MADRGALLPGAEIARSSVSPGHPRLQKCKRSAATPNENADSNKNRKSWFAIKHIRPKQDWFEVKRNFMRRADMAKYTQNADLAEHLLACGDAQIVEDSTSDSF